MKTTYLESRIMDALRKTKGNQTKAIQLMMSMAIEDPQIMLGLAKPHLKGITAHAVGRAVKNMSDKNVKEEIPEAPKETNNLIEDGKADSFGLEILKAVSKNSNPQFGHEAGSAPSPKRGGASKRHIDAINYLASKNKNI